jgi:hypothetical protein
VSAGGTPAPSWAPRRLAQTLLAAAVLVACLPGCGGEDDQGSGPSASDRGRDSGAANESSASPSPAESIRTYGAQADGDTETAIAAAVRDFYAAKASGDGARTCTLLASAARKSLVQTMGRSGELKGKDCGAIVSLVLEQQEPRYRARMREVEVTGARLQGDRALALIEIEASSEEVIPVRQDGGSWKVAAMAGSEIP